MKKNFGKSIVILIVFLVLTSAAFSRNDIGSWTIDVIGLSECYNLQMYFENGQTYCNLYNINNGNMYSGQMDIFNPMVKPSGSYGFNISFNNGEIDLRGFEQKSRFEGSIIINNRTYEMKAIGSVDSPNLQGDGYNGSVDEVLNFTYEGHKNLEITVNAYYNGYKTADCDNYLKVFINGVDVTGWFFEDSKTLTAEKGDIIRAVIRYVYNNGTYSEIDCSVPSYMRGNSYVLQNSGTFDFHFDATLELRK